VEESPREEQAPNPPNPSGGHSGKRKRDEGPSESPYKGIILEVLDSDPEEESEDPSDWESSNRTPTKENDDSPNSG